MIAEGILTISAAIFLLWFVFRKSRNKNRGTIPPPITVNISTTSTTSTSSDLTGKYEVFLSFRGTDTRHGFTDFLYTYLVGAGICTFRDDNDLRIGEEIGPDLLKAIKDSKISIPIFSENYAESKWCLRELEQMVECQRSEEGKLIFPIFYHVEPHDVRNQTGSYEEAFRQHENEFDEATVKKWKDAMTTVGKLKGLELKKEANIGEGEAVKMVFEKVVLALKKNYRRVPDNLVGMDHHVEEMDRLLDVKYDGVRIVGIHGMGGIGKTTISKAIYNQLCDRFECCCFLEDVRERSKHHNSIVVLQNELISKLSKQQADGIDNAEEGLDKIKAVASGKKVLIVLDDIDEMSQFDKLVGKSNHFGVGSRIIVTTRTKEVLDKIKATEGMPEVYKSYEPRLMTDDNSLQLFSKYAFKQDFPPEDYNKLSEDVVSTASGLPLVLVTIGSLLFGKRDKTLWEETLKKLKRIPHKKVLDKLKISYETLDHEQKQIFLDIACFFIGEVKEIPYYMWDDYELYPRSGIDTLILRSLVEVGDDNTLRMHDQLRDLGRQIVREENLNKLGKRSRLWHREEALDVLNRNLGTNNVVALNLDLGVIEEDKHEQLQVYERAEFEEGYQLAKTKLYIRRLVGQDFSQLPNLRFLTLGYAFLDGDFRHLFTNLRWLKWTYPAGKCIPTNLYLNNLVILDLSNSQITDEWEGWNLFKAAIKLKVLNLSNCRELLRGPDFSMFTTLEVLNLRTTFLSEVNPSLGTLVKLRDLDLYYCGLPKLDCSTFTVLESLNLSAPLSEVTGLEQSQSLTKLKASNCSRLRTFGDLSNLKRIKKIEIYYCPLLTEIRGLENLDSLELLDINGCKSIVRLPDLSRLRITKLILKDCKNLREIGGLQGLESLEHLDMIGCSSVRRIKKIEISYCPLLTEIRGLEKLDGLELLDMNGCKSIVTLPDLSRLRMLTKLILKHCENLREIGGLQGLQSLEHLVMIGCYSVKRLPDLSNLGKLRKLLLNDCKNLHECRGFKGLESLEHLDMSGCSSVKSLSDLSNLGKLKKVILFGCKNLNECGGFKGLESLEHLDMHGCSLVKSLPDLSNLGKLKTVLLNYCKDIHECGGFKGLESLEHLDMSWCSSVKSLPDLTNLGKLKKLLLKGCKDLQECGGFQGLESLEHLDMTGCTSLKSLPDLSNLGMLKNVLLIGCENLHECGGFKDLKSLENLDMTGCSSVKSLPDLSNLRKLKKVLLNDCKVLDECGGFKGLESLEHLDMTRCSSVKRLPDLSNLGKLKKALFFNCTSLRVIEGLKGLVSLEVLNMTYCECLGRLPDMSNSIMLKELILRSCTILWEVASFGGLESLEILDMRSCQSIETLPDLSDLRKLKELNLSWCLQLRDIKGLSGLVSLENLRLVSCGSLGNTLDFSNLKNLKELIAKSLENWSEIKGLEELKSLQVLDIRGCSSLEKLPKLSNLISLKYLYAFDIKYVPPVQELEELKKQNCHILLDNHT